MAGVNPPTLASAFVRLLQRESRCPAFARHHPICRRHGTSFCRFVRAAGFCHDDNGFCRNGKGRGLRHRSRLGGHRRRPFVLNHRRQSGRRHGRPGQAPMPATGHGVQEVGANVAGPLAPPPSAFSIPPMDWLLGGPATPFLGEDFDTVLAPPPSGIFFNDDMDGVASFVAHGYGPCPACDGVLLCPVHGYGPCPPALETPSPEQQVVDALHAYPDLSMPTPSDEDPEHFLPPGYSPVPDLESPPWAVLGFELNAMAEAEDEEMPVVASASPPASPPPAPPALAAPSLPSPTPEARHLLRQFAAAMARHSSSARTGMWSPPALGFSNKVPGLGESSSSAGQPRA
uniref:Uncharacterized protein n=1 Tax=Avena sativa TaxID=4498 RepID=A0ACD5X0A8_AVESA